MRKTNATRNPAKNNLFARAGNGHVAITVDTRPKQVESAKFRRNRAVEKARLRQEAW